MTTKKKTSKPKQRHRQTRDYQSEHYREMMMLDTRQRCGGGYRVLRSKPSDI